MDCGICLQNISVRGLLPCCDHHFCSECIVEWSNTSNTCPLCKARFYSIVEIVTTKAIGGDKTRQRVIPVNYKEQVAEDNFDPADWFSDDSHESGSWDSDSEDEIEDGNLNFAQLVGYIRDLGRNYGRPAARPREIVDLTAGNFLVNESLTTIVRSLSQRQRTRPTQEALRTPRPTPRSQASSTNAVRDTPCQYRVRTRSQTGVSRGRGAHPLNNGPVTRSITSKSSFVQSTLCALSDTEVSEASEFGTSESASEFASA